MTDETAGTEYLRGRKAAEDEAKAAPKTMRMILIHGTKRADRSDLGDDWGHNGPTLHGIISLHVTYLTTYNVYFATKELADAAAELTGWKHWDDTALEMPFVDELVMVHDNHEGQGKIEWAVKGHHGPSYYGDWELQTQSNSGEHVS